MATDGDDALQRRSKTMRTYELLRDLAHNRAAADMVRRAFAERVGGQQGVAVRGLVGVIDDVVARSKVLAGKNDREILLADRDDLAAWWSASEPGPLIPLAVTDWCGLDQWPNGTPPADFGPSMRDLPSELAAAITVHVLSALDGLIAEIEKAFVAVDGALHKLDVGAVDQALADAIFGWRCAPKGSHYALTLHKHLLSSSSREGLIAALEAQNALRCVFLSDCVLRDKDLALLLPVLQGMQHLRVLCLRRNALSIASAAALRDALEDSALFPALQVLDLSDNLLPPHVVAGLQERATRRFTGHCHGLKQDAWVLRLPQRKVRVLSLDGGGAKCVSQLETLMHLEVKLGAPLNDQFDLIQGVGVGGVIAAAIRNGSTLKYIHGVVREICETVYTTSDWTVLWAVEAGYRKLRTATSGDWYSGAHLQWLLAEKLFKDGLKLHDLKKPVGVVTATATPGVPLREAVWRSYASMSTLPAGEVASEDALAAVCRAAMATPDYLFPVPLNGDKQYCDAGPRVNGNPALLVFSELVQQMDARDLVIVSVGCGRASDAREEAGYSLASHYVHGMEAGPDSQRAPLPSPAHPHLAMTCLAEGTAGVAYHRINPAPCRPLLFDYTKVPFDECHDTVLDQLEQAAGHWLEGDEGAAALDGAVAALSV